MVVLYNVIIIIIIIIIIIVVVVVVRDRSLFMRGWGGGGWAGCFPVTPFKKVMTQP